MAILTRDMILDAVRTGAIAIEPFTEDQVGPGSVDLTLGSEFRTFKKLHDIFPVRDDINYESITECVTVEDCFVVMPGETVLGITRERIHLPPTLCGWLEGRSRFSRLGLMVQSASFIQPGINNRQVLEITNVSSMPLALYPGTRICQFIFEETKGAATYAGTFKDQITP